ncbi:MAG: O-antigen translocase [Bacillota bacterium]
MTFLKTVSMSGIATVAKILTGLVSTKILAVLIGPSGVALIGQINNLIAIVLPIGSGGINNGVVKYLAESDSVESAKKYVKQAVLITLICSLICSVLLLAFARYLSFKLLETAEYTYVIVFLAVFFILMAFNGIFLSILNGLRQIRKLIIAQIISSFISLVITVALAYMFNIKGVLIASILSQSIICLVSFWYCWKCKVLQDIFVDFSYDKSVLKKYCKYTIMTLVSAFTVPIGQLLIRNNVINKLGLVDAGILQGMWTISGVYLMVITIALSTYYLPKLSGLSDRADVWREIKSTLVMVAPAVAIMVIVLFCSREIIVNLLFTQDFFAMNKLFGAQLIGDFIRIISFVFAFIMQAKALVKQMIFGEIIFTFLYVVMVRFFVIDYGLVGVPIAYCLVYLSYLFYSIFVYYRWHQVLA